MPLNPIKHPRRQPARLLAAVLLMALAAPPLVRPAVAAESIEPGQLWILREYRVAECEPMPKLPTVFNWLIRKALAIEDFFAASADCGQIGRRGAREGWTYVFWSEREGTAVENLVRKAQERYGLTQLVALKEGESFPVRAKGYEAFVMIQLRDEQGPARIWAAGDVAELEARISVAAPGELQVRVESTTHEGKSCVGMRVLKPEEPVRQRQRLACQAGG